MMKGLYPLQLTMSRCIIHNNFSDFSYICITFAPFPYIRNATRHNLIHTRTTYLHEWPLAARKDQLMYPTLLTSPSRLTPIFSPIPINLQFRHQLQSSTRSSRRAIHNNISSRSEMWYTAWGDYLLYQRLCKRCVGLAAHTWSRESPDIFPANENRAVRLVVAAGEDEVVDWRHCLSLYGRSRRR